MYLNFWGLSNCDQHLGAAFPTKVSKRKTGTVSLESSTTISQTSVFSICVSLVALLLLAVLCQSSEGREILLCFSSKLVMQNELRHHCSFLTYSRNARKHFEVFWRLIIYITEAFSIRYALKTVGFIFPLHTSI